MRLLFLFLLFSCKTFVLKKDISDIPFKAKEGKYHINVFKLEYPKSLSEKINFLNSFYDFLKTIVTDKKRISLALNEDFINDFIYIEKNGLLKDESFISKAASDLDSSEKEALLKILNKEIKEYKSQELLNFQVEALYKILRREDLFEAKRSYTELNKERALDNLRAIRTRVVKAIKSSMIELIIVIDNLYSKNEYNTAYKKYYYSKNVSLFNNISFSNNFNKYKKYGTILFKNIKKKDLTEILSSEVDLGLDYYIVENDYSGYKYLTNGRIIFFVGGEHPVNTSKGYEVMINVKEYKIEELKDIESQFIIKDLFIKK